MKQKKGARRGSKWVILLISMLLVTSCFAGAVSAKTDGKDKDKDGGPPDVPPGQDKDKDKGGGPPDVPPGQNKDKGSGESGGDTSAGRPGAMKGKYRGSANDGVTVGELVSTAGQAKMEQWKITKDELKEMGYHGPVSGFVTAFNEEINAQKADIREKILAGDEELTQAVVKETAERELARIRDEQAAGLYMSDTAFVVSLAKLVGSAGDKDLRSAIQDELGSMDPAFKKEVYLIATEGSDEEKQALAEQLRELIS